VDGKAKAEAVFTGSMPGPAPSKVPEAHFGKPHDREIRFVMMPLTPAGSWHQFRGVTKMVLFKKTAGK